MYYNVSTEMWHEKNAVKNHADKIIGTGTRAMIITGKSSAKNGSLNDILEVLKSGNREYIIFDETEENPSVETVIKASEKALAEGIDFIIGIGGGSPLDASKAIAVLAGTGTLSADILYDASSEIKPLPVIAVPTTCGTGSEVTGASVLTLHTQRTKKAISHKIYPKYALVDSRYLETAPVSLIRNTALDALAHLIESKLHKGADDYGKMSMEKGLSVWGECRKCLESGVFSSDDYDRLMTASVMAGLSIRCSGTTVPHGLSYRVTYETEMPHGKACAVFLPGYLAAAPADISGKILKTAGFSDITDFMSCMKKLCGDVKIENEILDRTVKDLLENKAKLESNSFEADEKILTEIAYSFFKGVMTND